MDDLTKEFLAESLEGLDRMERCLTELETRPNDAELLAEIFRAVHTIKGSSGFLGLTRLERLAHAGEHMLCSLRDGTLSVSVPIVTCLLTLRDRLRSILELMERFGHTGTRAVDEDKDLIALLEMLNTPLPTQPVTAPTPDLQLEEPHPHEILNGAANAQDKTLRVEVATLNRMMNLVGDLVLTRNRLLQRQGRHSLPPELAASLDCVTADLRETVMQARLQPLGALFSRFPRMVRELARTCGKQIRLEFSGQETGLDKSLLEAVRDPLVHAVRNAVDHGIESTAARVLAGKPAEGLLRLSACQQNGWVVLEVADDGSGIARERVLAKAVARGLVTAEAAAELSDRDALHLIFLPGFSTASEVTHISGRGVGMDVIKANLERAGGTVEIESNMGAGTVLRMRVPLTLAIVPAIVVRAGGRSFCLPQSALLELVYVPHSNAPQPHCQTPPAGTVTHGQAGHAVERVGEGEAYMLRDTLLPMVRLDALLELPHAAAAHGFYLAVLDADGVRFGLAVDDLLTPEEIVVKPLSEALRRIGLYSGATVLGCGSMAIILDVHAVAERAGILARAMQLPAQQATAPAQASQMYLVYECARSAECASSAAARPERLALPLERIERIETVTAGEIEFAEGRPLLQYRGVLLPVEDVGGRLGRSSSADPLTMLICAAVEGAQRFAKIVDSVVEVASVAIADAAAGQGTAPARQPLPPRVAVLNRRVTCFAEARLSLPEVA